MGMIAFQAVSFNSRQVEGQTQDINENHIFSSLVAIKMIDASAVGKRKPTQDLECYHPSLNLTRTHVIIC